MMKILEIKLLSDNLLETERFYLQILGLELLSKDEKSISFKAGISKLHFMKSTDVNPTYHFAFNIPNNKLNQAISWLNSRVKLIPIEANEVIADFKNWNAKSIYFYDNNKNILEFIARFDLNNSSYDQFGVEVIQSISELGLVADSPRELAEDLIQIYGLSYFEKGAQREKFKTLGSDEGLVIIVQPDHFWYPTKMPVQKHFLEIRLSVNNVIKHIEIGN